MNFQEIWAKYWKWILGGAGGLVVLALAMRGRGSNSTPVDPNASVADGSLVVADAISAQNENLSGALGAMASQQQNFMEAIYALYDRPSESAPTGSSITYIEQTPAPVVEPPAEATVQQPIKSSLETVAYTYGTGTPDYANAEASAQAAEKESRIRSDPAYREKEIARTLSVIDFRKSKGYDTSAQKTYLDRLVANDF